MVAFTVFDPQYLPAESDPSHKEYGKDKISHLCQHYGRELEVVEEGKVVKFSPDIDSELVREEWNIYRQFLSTKKEVGKDRQASMEEVLKSSIYTQMFPNIVKLLSILLCLPVSTASVEHNFSAMKTIKTRLRNRLSDITLSHLMRIAIAGPDTLI